MNTSRRGFLLGLGAALAAPAIIRTPGLLMPVRALAQPAALSSLAWVDEMLVNGPDNPVDRAMNARLLVGETPFLDVAMNERATYLWRPQTPMGEICVGPRSVEPILSGDGTITLSGRDGSGKLVREWHTFAAGKRVNVSRQMLAVEA